MPVVSLRNKLIDPVVCLLLVCAIVIAYEPIRHNGFIRGDDFEYVTENPNVNGGITARSLLRAFTGTLGGNWHPVTTVSHMLDCELFGLNPFAHHIVNLLLHIANTLLLFYFLRLATGSIWPAAFVAALFALHPLRVESVAWVAERKDVLSGLFWFLTLLAYTHYVRRRTVGRYIIVVLLFCLGLMAKPMLVTLPFCLLLLDYWPLKRFGFAETVGKAGTGNIPVQTLSFWQLLIEKIPLLLLAMPIGVITYIVQKRTGMMSFAAYLPFGLRLSNAAASYAGYIEKFFYPARLGSLYPYRPISGTCVNLSVLLLIVVSAVVIKTARRRRYLLIGWLWYLVTLLPVIGVVQVGAQRMADRYTYLPGIGLALMAAWAAAGLAARQRAAKVLVAITAAAVLVVFIVFTRRQVRYWRDTTTLCRRTLAVTRDNFIVNDLYGQALLEQGRLDDAIAQFRRSVQIEPRFMAAVAHLGLAYKAAGKPRPASALLARALAYGRAAEKLARQGELTETLTYLAATLERKPYRIVPITDLAWFFATCKDAAVRDPNEAIRLAELACRLSSYGNARTLDTLAAAYASAGKFTPAIETAQKAIELSRAAGYYESAEKIRRRLELYRQGKAYLRN